MSAALDLETAKAQLWAQGVIAPWYLRPSQLDIYELLHREKRPFVEASRRFGKTTGILAFVFEKLIQNPGWIWRWCEPQKDQARKIVMPIIDSLQAGIPKHLQAEYYTTDSVYRFPNGSKLYLLGVNEDKGKSARGPAANGITLDEYGFWNEAQRISRSILYPQLQNQEGQWFIKASTPPEDLGHVYYIEKEIAQRKDRYILKIIFDNEALTKDEMAEIIDETGGMDTPDFKREYLCQEIADPELLVVREWSEEHNTVPNDYPRPRFYTPYVAGDSGADDNTAVLFGYYDFEKDETVIEGEIIKNGKTTKRIVRHAKLLEKILWNRPPESRVYDAPKQLIYDIFTEHKWPVIMPDKTDKMAAIHRLRTTVGARKFKVKERCRHLRRQLKVGTWKDAKKNDFKRDKEGELGHLDAIAAAVYFNRHVNKTINPAPPHQGLSPQTHLLPKTTPSQSPEAQLAALMFGRRKG